MILKLQQNKDNSFDYHEELKYLCDLYFFVAIRNQEKSAILKEMNILENIKLKNVFLVLYYFFIHFRKF